MNRIQFYVVTGLAGLLFLLVLADILLAHKVSGQQAQLSQAQQIVNQGNVLYQKLNALVKRVVADVQKTGDQGMKDLMARQQISIKDKGATDNSNDTTAPATPATH